MEGGRTDNQILDGEPVKCQLGDREYELKPQMRSKGRKFRKAFAEVQERLGANSIVETDEMIDLVYEYDASLGKDRKWIDDNATDAQLVNVFAVIYGFVFGPLVKQLPAALAKAQGLDPGVLEDLVRERMNQESSK